MPEGLGLASSIPVINEVADFDDYYISYNSSSSGYGTDTTAIVIGDDIGVYLVLCGNHKEQYEAIQDKTLQNCIDYFIDNIDQAHKFSDHHSILKGDIPYRSIDKAITLIGQDNLDKMKVDRKEQKDERLC